MEPGNDTVEPGNDTVERGNVTVEPGNDTVEPGNDTDPRDGVSEMVGLLGGVKKPVDGVRTGTPVETIVPGGRVVPGATIGDAALVLQTAPVLFLLIPSKPPDSYETSENRKSAEEDFFQEVLLEEEAWLPWWCGECFSGVRDVVIVWRVRDGGVLVLSWRVWRYEDLMVSGEGEDRHDSCVDSEGDPAEDEEGEEEEEDDENGFLKKNEDGDSRSVGRNRDGEL